MLTFDFMCFLVYSIVDSQRRFGNLLMFFLVGESKLRIGLFINLKGELTIKGIILFSLSQCI